MITPEYIDKMLLSIEKPKKKVKARYKKPEAVKQLENDWFEYQYRNKQHLPEHIRVKDKFRDDSANGLTKCIIKYLKINGAFATRLNSTGMYRNDLKRFVHSNQVKGMADIIATYKGLSLNIEVKIGYDKMSVHQLKVKKDIEQAGGYYFIARNFTEFKEYFVELKKNNE